MYRGGKPSCWALDLGVPMEKVAGIDRRRWWVQVDNMEAGLCICQRGAGGRFWVCCMKQQCRAMTGGAGWGLISWRWRVSYTIRQCEAGGQGLGQKPETKQSWLGFGHTAWNGSAEWFQGVVGAG